MLPAARTYDRRQLWNLPTTTTAHHHCTPFTLPSQGHFVVEPSLTITLTANAVFTPECSALTDADNVADGISTVTDLRDPFHASVTPQVYATAAATVIAWMLVIMLVITPRTFFLGGAGGSSGLMGRRGMISGATGGASIIGVGSRPWLQKVAALTVAVSLTIATADTFKVAEQQYQTGYMNALNLRNEVVSSLEIKITRVISDIFIWLAQVQTLIRLFPRHKEKVMIKWTGFALIVLDTIFSCLDNFMSTSDGDNDRFNDALPALSYLFHLALSLLYSAWVIYYSLTKSRYAFYHSMMWNISLVALLSVVAVLTPVVFFITDISNETVAGWGDYFRWVGAAAASVIVWEWVERIEALEREEKKDGILGREIFDGDDMLDVTPSEEVIWPGSRYRRNQFRNTPGNSGGAYSSSANSRGPNGISAYRRAAPNHKPVSLGRTQHSQGILGNPQTRTQPDPANPVYATIPIPPPAVASPVSRTDTISAGSTTYAVHYHPVSEPSPSLRRSSSSSRRADRARNAQRGSNAAPTHHPDTSQQWDGTDGPAHLGKNRLRWQAVTNTFRRRPTLPPPEVRSARTIEANEEYPSSQTPQPTQHYPLWDVKSRLGIFAAEQGERFRERYSTRQVHVDNLPVMIIPAQPRGRTWSPEILYAPQITSQAGGEQAGDPSSSAQQDDHGAHATTAARSSVVWADFSNRPSDANSAPRPGPSILLRSKDASHGVLGRPQQSPEDEDNTSQ